MDEIKQGNIQQGIWGQALVEADGDEAKTEAIYIRLRADSLRDEIQLMAIAEKEYAESSAAKTAPKNVTKPKPANRLEKPKQTTNEYAGYKYELNMTTGVARVLYDPHKNELDENIEGERFPNSYELRMLIDKRKELASLKDDSPHPFS